jgi:hypothetical protein
LSDVGHPVLEPIDEISVQVNPHGGPVPQLSLGLPHQGADLLQTDSTRLLVEVSAVEAALPIEVVVILPGRAVG